MHRYNINVVNVQEIISLPKQKKKGELLKNALVKSKKARENKINIYNDTQEEINQNSSFQDMSLNSLGLVCTNRLNIG